MFVPVSDHGRLWNECYYSICANKAYDTLDCFWSVFCLVYNKSYLYCLPYTLNTYLYVTHTTICTISSSRVLVLQDNSFAPFHNLVQTNVYVATWIRWRQNALGLVISITNRRPYRSGCKQQNAYCPAGNSLAQERDRRTEQVVYMCKTANGL